MPLRAIFIFDKFYFLIIFKIEQKKGDFLNIIICIPAGTSNYVRYEFNKHGPIWKSIDCCFFSIKGKINLMRGIYRKGKIKRKKLRSNFKREDIEFVKNVFNSCNCGVVEVCTADESHFLFLHFDCKVNTRKIHNKIVPLLLSKIPQENSSFPAQSFYI